MSSLRDQLRDLPYDTGRWQGTTLGKAAREKIEATRQRRQAEEFARYPGMSIRMRHSWRKTARAWAAAEIEATQRYEDLAAPIHERLEADLRSTELHVGYLEHQDRTRSTWLDEHPDLRHRIAAIDRELDPTPTIQQRLQALEVKRPDHGLDLGLGL